MFKEDLYLLNREIMDKIAKIKAEIERRLLPTVRNKHYDEWEEGGNNALINILSFINSLPEEPVSEDLEEAADNYANSLSEKCDKTYVAVDFKAGAQWQKERMTINSIEATAKVDSGGYPYVDLEGIELYDYDKDIPLAKEGDKVKIVVIRSEEE